MEGVSGLNGIETQQVMSQARKKGTFPKRAYIYVNLFLYDSDSQKSCAISITYSCTEFTLLYQINLIRGQFSTAESIHCEARGPRHKSRVVGYYSLYFRTRFGDRSYRRVRFAQARRTSRRQLNALGESLVLIHRHCVRWDFHPLFTPKLICTIM